MAGNDIVVRALLDDSGFVRKWANLAREIKTNTALWKTQFRELSSSGNWVKAYQAKLEGLQRTSKLYEQESKDLARQMEATARVTREANPVYDQLKEKIEALAKQGGQGATEKMAKLQAQLAKTAETVERTNPEYDKLASKLATTNEKMSQTNEQIKKTNSGYIAAQNQVQKLSHEYELLDKTRQADIKLADAQGQSMTAAAKNVAGLTAQHSKLSEKLLAEKSVLNELKSAKDKDTDAIEKQELQVKDLALQEANLTREYKEAKVALAQETAGTKELASSTKELEATRRADIQALELQGDKEGAQVKNYRMLGESVKAYEQQIKAEQSVLKEVGHQFGRNSDEYREQIAVIRDLKSSYTSLISEEKQAAYALKSTGLELVNENLKQLRASVKASAETFRMVGDEANALRTEETGLKTETTLLADKQKQLKTALASASQEFGSSSTKAKELRRDLQQLKEDSAQNKIRIDDNSVKQAEESVKSLDRELALMQAKTRESEAVFRANNQTLLANREHVIGLSQQYKILGSTLTAQVNKLNELTSAERQNASAISEQRVAIANTKANMASMAGEITKTAKTLPGMSTGFARVVDGSNKIGNSLRNTGRTMTSFGMNAVMNTTMIGGAFAKGAKDAAELSHAYNINNNLLKTSGEGAAESQRTVNKMRVEGRKLSLEYGDSQKTIAKGYEELIRRGYDGESALASLKDIMYASKASGDSLSDTLRTTTSTLEGFGLRSTDASTQMKNTRMVANTLAYAADTTATDFHGMGVAMTYVSQAAHTVGYSVSDTASAIGVLSNNGVEAEKAGTGFRKVLTSLSAPTATAKDTLDSFGVKLTEVDAKTGKTKLRSLPDIFGQLNGAIKDLPQDQQLGILKAVFGQTGMQAAGIFLNNTKQLSETMKDVGANATEAGSYIQKLAHANMKDPASQMKIFKATLDDVVMQLGDSMMPTINKTMQGIERLIHWFSGLSDGTKSLIANTALASAGLGAMALVFGPLVSSVGIATKTVSGFIKIAGRIKDVTTMAELAGAVTGFGRYGSAAGKAGKEAKLLSEANKGLTFAEIAAQTGVGAAGLGKFGGAAGKAGKEVATAGKSAGLLKTAGAALFGTMGVGVPVMLGLAAAAAVGVVGWKVYKDHVDKVKKAEKERQETGKYNIKMTQSQAKEFSKMQKEADVAEISLRKLSNVKLNPENIKDAAGAFGSWAQVVNSQVQGDIDKTSARIKKLQAILDDPSASAAMKSAAKSEIDTLNEKNQSYEYSKQTVTNAQQEVTDILTKAANEHRSLTKDEMTKMEEDRKAILAEQIQTNTKFSQSQRDALTDMINNANLSDLSLKQLRTSMKNYGEVLGQSLGDTITQAKEQAKAIGGKEGKRLAWKDFFEQNAESIKPLVSDFNTQLKKIDWDNQAQSVKDYGKSYDNLKASVQAAGIDWGQFQKQFHIASKQGVEDVENWNHTTPEQKEIMLKNDEGHAVLLNAMEGLDSWNDLSVEEKAFIAEDKASEALIKPLEKSGEWDKMDPKIKNLIVKDLASGNTDRAKAKVALWNASKADSKNLKANDAASKVLAQAGIKFQDWNKLSPKEKRLVAEDLSSGKVDSAKNRINVWNTLKPGKKKLEATDAATKLLKTAGVSVDQYNKLSPRKKKLLADDLASGNVKGAKKQVADWNKISPKQAKIIAKNMATKEAQLAVGSVKNWNKLTPKQQKILVNDMASGKTDKAKQKIALWNAAKPNAKNLTAKDSASKLLSSAGIKLKDWNKLTPSQKKLIANDLASGKSTTARKQIESWNKQKAAQKKLEALNRTHPGVMGAQGTIDSLHGKTSPLKGSNQAGPGKASAQGTIDSLHGKTSPLQASNQAGQGKGSAQRTINSLQGKTANLHASNQTHGGVSSAKSSIDSVHGKTVTITSVFKSIYKKIKEGFATGTSGASTDGNYWLGDGGKNEPYLTPEGRLGVSPADWTLTPLPAGTKVWSSMSAFSADTGRTIDPSMIPKFATGGTVPVAGQMQGIVNANDTFRTQQQQPAPQSTVVNVDNQDVIQVLQKMVSLLTEGNQINKNNRSNTYVESAKSMSERLAFEAMKEQRGSMG